MQGAHANPSAAVPGRQRIHEHPAEDYAARSHPEFVVMEIGEQIGGLVAFTDEPMHGVEIEISPTGRDAQRSHKQVLERSIGGRPAFAAVFDGLPAGSYTLWVENRARARDVRVQGGSITELDWRGAARNPSDSPEVA